MGNGNRQNAEEIVCRLKQSGYEAYFVGGCVRDFILGNASSDYDIVTSALPDQVMAIFSTPWPSAQSSALSLLSWIIILTKSPHSAVMIFTKMAGSLPKSIFLPLKKMYSGRDFTVNGLLNESGH